MTEFTSCVAYNFIVCLRINVTLKQLLYWNKRIYFDWILCDPCTLVLLVQTMPTLGPVLKIWKSFLDPQAGSWWFWSSLCRPTVTVCSKERFWQNTSLVLATFRINYFTGSIFPALLPKLWELSFISWGKSWRWYISGWQQDLLSGTLREPRRNCQVSLEEV